MSNQTPEKSQPSRKLRIVLDQVDPGESSKILAKVVKTIKAECTDRDDVEIIVNGVPECTFANEQLEARLIAELQPQLESRNEQLNSLNTEIMDGQTQSSQVVTSSTPRATPVLSVDQAEMSWRDHARRLTAFGWRVSVEVLDVVSNYGTITGLW